MSKQISNIVFTKNRPLQLEAYLRSLYVYFPKELFQTYIIYKPELFDSEYHEVFSRYPELIIIEESDFHTDLLEVIDSSETPYIMFGIDDVVFFDSVDFQGIDRTFKDTGKQIFGFSLRFDPNFVKQNTDEVISEIIAGQNIFKVDWTQGKTPDTRYPFELCATIYRTELVKKIVKESMNQSKIIKKMFGPQSFLIKVIGKNKLGRKLLKSFGFFYSPNTFESWVCRWCKNNSGILPNFLFCKTQCASAIQVNMVNTSTKGPFESLSGFTVESLNEKFRHGYRIDINFLTKNKPSGVSCGNAYFKLENIKD